MNTIKGIQDWFEKAKPTPTNQNLVTQLAVHVEEIAEMFDALKFEVSAEFMRNLKQEVLSVVDQGEEACGNMIKNWDRTELLDSLCDQIVTATGVGVYAKMDMVGALEEVNASNHSKFDAEGKPILNEHGKIMKGENYFKPNLAPFVGEG